MNIFSGGADNVRKLEAQLKQKTIQMDNLDSTLSATKKELAEQRREKEVAEQELVSQSSKVNELEEQNNKLNKLVKQRNEYTFSLCSQIEAKTKELQQQEEALQHEKTQVYRMAKEVDDVNARNKMLESEISRLNSSFSQVETKLKSIEKERGREVDGLQEELLTAQHSLDQQRLRLEEAEAKVHSGQLGQENRGLSIDSLRAKLVEKENVLASERASFQRQLDEAQRKCSDAVAAAADARRESDGLQNAASAAQRKASELQQHVECQQATPEREVSPTVAPEAHRQLAHEKQQLEQQNIKLDGSLKDALAEVQQLKTLTATASTEVDELRSQVKKEKAQNQDLQMRMENLQLTLGKQKEESSAAALTSKKDHTRALSDLSSAEQLIKKLEGEKRELLDEQQSLHEKLRRGSEAIKKVSKEQEKLESKLLKLSSDREAAVAEAESSRASVKRLERDIVEMTRCNAKNKQDLEESRTRATSLERELADVRGQLAEAQLPPVPTPGSGTSGPGGEKQRMALRDQCTALDSRLQEAKKDAENLRAQLQEEQGKHEQAKKALVAEQQYFTSKLAELEMLTKGEAAGTPGGQVHVHIQHMKKRFSEVPVTDEPFSSSQPQVVTPLRVHNRPATTPRSTGRMSLSRQGTEASLSMYTPRSGKVAQESAKYWHRKYEEQSARASALESKNRSMQVQLLRSGGTDSDMLSLATHGVPQTQTPTLGGGGLTPPPRSTPGVSIAGEEQARVNRELRFDGATSASLTPASFDGEAGQENDESIAQLSPALTGPPSSVTMQSEA